MLVSELTSTEVAYLNSLEGITVSETPTDKVGEVAVEKLTDYRNSNSSRIDTLIAQNFSGIVVMNDRLDLVEELSKRAYPKAQANLIGVQTPVCLKINAKASSGFVQKLENGEYSGGGGAQIKFGDVFGVDGEDLPFAKFMLDVSGHNVTGNIFNRFETLNDTKFLQTKINFESHNGGHKRYNRLQDFKSMLTKGGKLNMNVEQTVRMEKIFSDYAIPSNNGKTLVMQHPVSNKPTTTFENFQPNDSETVEKMTKQYEDRVLLKEQSAKLEAQKHLAEQSVGTKIAIAKAESKAKAIVTDEISKLARKLRKEAKEDGETLSMRESLEEAREILAFAAEMNTEA